VSLENRIERLEKTTGADKPARKTMVLIGPPDEKTLNEAIAEAIRLGIGFSSLLIDSFCDTIIIGKSSNLGGEGIAIL